MRILFAGTPAVAATALRRLAASEHEVVGAVTRPPAPRGRSKALVPSDVDVAARELGVAVLSPAHIRDARDEIVALRPQLAVVVAYGGLVPPSLLGLFPWVNLHFSLLPRWRGAAPVQRAIAAGDMRTGVSIFQLEEGLDTGPIYAQREVPLTGTETTADLLPRLGDLGADLLVGVAGTIESGSAAPVPQVGEPTYAPRLTPAEGRVNWAASAVEVSRLTRAFWDNPGAWTTTTAGVRVKLGPVAAADDAVLQPGQVALRGRQAYVGTGAGDAVLSTVAPAGKKHMDAAAWLRGVRGEITFD